MQMFTSLNDPALVALLKRGAVGVIPTDTVYGLVCLASTPKSVNRLYALKGRERKPGTLIAASIDQFVELGVPYDQIKQAKQFWPGAVSVETPHEITYLHQGTGRQALRVPDYDELRKLLSEVGALQTTSANQPGEAVAETIAEAVAYFGDSVDFYVDGGELRQRPPSTIIRLVDGKVEIIREGAVKIRLVGEEQNERAK